MKAENKRKVPGGLAFAFPLRLSVRPLEKLCLWLSGGSRPDDQDNWGDALPLSIAGTQISEVALSTSADLPITARYKCLIGVADLKLSRHTKQRMNPTERFEWNRVNLGFRATHEQGRTALFRFLQIVHRN